MSANMKPIVEAIEARASADEFLGLDIPPTCRAVTTHAAGPRWDLT